MAKIGRPRKEYYQNKTDMEPPPAPPVRTGGRVKKAKVVFDPSDTYITKKRAGRSLSLIGSDDKEEPKVELRGRRKSMREEQKVDSPEPEEMCSVCGVFETKKNRKLIFCLDCNYKVHVNCLDVNFTDVQILRNNYRCDECKTCSSCYEGQEEGVLVTCSDCVNSYHLECHVPKVSKHLIKEEKWVCTKCRKPTIIKNETSANIVRREGLTSTSVNFTTKEFPSKPIRDSHKIEDCLELIDRGKIRNDIEQTEKRIISNDMKLNHNSLHFTHAKNVRVKHPLPRNLPKHSEIATWTTDKVTEYFRKYFPNEASYFKSNEIDGTTLLLLKRSDIVRQNGYTLGSLLGLYSFVVKIQKGSNDYSLCWA